LVIEEGGFNLFYGTNS